MDHVQKMRDNLARVENATRNLAALAPVIAREVDRRFGDAIAVCQSDQERDNLRQHYTIQVGRENVWKQTYLADRDLAIRLVTMHGIAALVEQNIGTQVTKVL